VRALQILDIFPAGSSFTALRGFRLMRILKLVRRWKSIQRVVTVIASSLPAIGAFICVLFIVIFAFAIFGMEFFGDNMYVLPPPPSPCGFTNPRLCASSHCKRARLGFVGCRPTLRYSA
jgi:hypothetical protein